MKKILSVLAIVLFSVTAHATSVVNTSSSTVTVVGGATSANQTNGNQKTQIVDGGNNTIGSANIGGNQSLFVDVTTSALPTGASTSALQSTINTSIGLLLPQTDFDSRVNTLGQKTSANSTPIVIASDQSAIPISAASLPLPTGAATAALQTTGNTSLASIDTKLTSQATAANQTTENTSLASIDSKLSSTATSAKQDTGNTSLASIDNKLTAPLSIVELSVATINFNTAIPLVGVADRTQLASNVVHQCLFQAPYGNTNIVYAGGSTVTNTSGANEGMALIQGSVLGPIPMGNTNEMYFAADTANDKIKVFCK